MILKLVLLASLAAGGRETDSRLADAAMKGDRALVRSLLLEAADVNVPAADGTTALHWAVRSDDLDTAELLIRAGANVKAVDRYGITPLYLACVNGNAAMLRKLLDAGADPNSTDPAGETALMTAARTGAPEALQIL